VAPNYFETWGTPLLEGRDFNDNDGAGSRRVALVDQAFAEKYFRGSAIGRKFTVGSEEQLRDLEIIGVVANTKYADPREPVRELVYVSAFQSDPFVPTIEIRANSPDNANAIAESARLTIANVFKAPVEVLPYSTLFARAIQQDRLVAVLSGLFGALGIGLASMGLFGVMAFAVRSRTREIGIRIVMGAAPADLVFLIVSEAIRLAAIGLVIGIPLALLAKQSIASLLYGLGAINYAALAAAVMVLVLTVLFAAAVPAGRAAAVDPALLFRAE
jgi:ABC-type antimicrobial peptide transport system permease subunit